MLKEAVNWHPMISHSEENYIKCIYKLAARSGKGVSTNAISAAISTSAASVTDMLKKLSEKKLLHYVRYKGVSLTEEGELVAKELIRKHRLWEVFLAEKLHMRWDEVHDIAEQLEHIHSPLLVQRLDEFLGHPRFDPHGDPIPDQHGNYSYRSEKAVSELGAGESGIVAGVRDHSTEFLRYLDAIGLMPGCHLRVISREPYDNSLRLVLSDQSIVVISEKVADNLTVINDH